MSARSAGNSDRNSSRSPVAGWSNASSAAWRKGRWRPSDGRRWPYVGVADERVTDRLQVDADLVGTAGFETALEPRQLGRGVEPFDEPVLGSRRPAVGDHGHAERVAPVASDRSVDDAVRGVGVTPHERHVTTARRVRRELGDQRRPTTLACGRPRAARSSRRRGGGRCPAASVRPRRRCRDIAPAGHARACPPCCRRRGARRGPPACRPRPPRRPRTRRRTPPTDRRRGAAPAESSTRRPRSADPQRDEPCR